VQSDTIALTTGAIFAVTPAPPPSPVATEPPPTGDPLLGRTVDGRYAIRATLGKGAVGAVYEAEHVELHKLVAVKVLHAAMARTEEFRKRFEREARSASRLAHPGCVSVIDFGHLTRLEPASHGDALLGMPYLVMELVKGELLSDRIDKGKLPPHEAVVIARGVLAALRHAHGLDIVHRDVKPTNISLASVGETAPLVKLLDFGLAKSVADDSPDAKQPLTQNGIVFGTPGYLSPEQAAGKAADARSDLYGFGVVLFEMVCGFPPFMGAEALDVVRDHLSKPPPSPRKFTPALSPELEAVILKALAKEPRARFQTAEEFQAALAACPEASTASLAPAATPAATSAPPAAAARAPRYTVDLQKAVALVRRHRRLLIAAGAATAMLAFVAWLIATRSSSPVATPPPAFAAAPAAAPGSAAARRHLELAQGYQQRLWCADAVAELERALKEDPELRADPDLIRIAIPCLRARTQSRTMQFLVERIGADGQFELQAALDGDLKPDVREGVQRVLAAIRSSER
jgi:serine/threonine-protein kinase